MGTIVYFESRVPTEWEKTHLPVILLTSDTWDPKEEVLCPGRKSQEHREMQAIRSLTCHIRSVSKEESKAQIEKNGEVETQLGAISCIYNSKDFCERIISMVNIATVHCNDFDNTDGNREISSIISNERHSKATAEELAHKWNVRIQTAKDTIRVTTQRGIQTAVHPMMLRVRVDHLNLHRQ
jgi:hypothetical protein